MPDEEQPDTDDWRLPPSDPGASAARWVQRNDTRVRRVIDLLEANLGTPRHPGRRDPLQVLVVTVLSQNTTDMNALRAYENLMKTFPPPGYEHPEQLELPRDEDGNIDSVEIRMSQVADALPSPDWDAVRTAAPEDVKESIRTCGLQHSKGPTIQRALTWLHERRTDYDMDPLLKDRSPDEALNLLTDIKGIGTKTAAVILMEATKKDLCPVDTHVHRTSTRLGLVDPDSSRNQTFRRLKDILPSGKGYSLHHNLLSFGRTVCTAQNPDCERCYLSRICRYYRNEQNEDGRTEKYPE